MPTGRCRSEVTCAETRNRSLHVVNIMQSVDEYTLAPCTEEDIKKNMSVKLIPLTPFPSLGLGAL